MIKIILKIKLQCCGNVGPSEYAGDIPPSCSSYVIGCNQAFYDFYRRNILLLALVGLIFGVIQILGIAITAFLANEIRLFIIKWNFKLEKFIMFFKKGLLEQF